MAIKPPKALDAELQVLEVFASPSPTAAGCAAILTSLQAIHPPSW
jgi:hypothetical protein